MKKRSGLKSNLSQSFFASFSLTKFLIVLCTMYKCLFHHKMWIKCQAEQFILATVASCQTKTFENDMFTKVADRGFHWSAMKSKLQFGPFAASFPLSQSRRKLQLIQRLKVHLHPQLLDRQGPGSYSSCSQLWGAQSSPGWYPLVLSPLPVASLHMSFQLAEF